MTFAEKLKDIRKRFGLSQEQLAEILNVSRQAITKWENDNGFPDISNLQELSKVFGVSVDYLLDGNSNLPLLYMKKVLDKEKYKNKLSSYYQILKEYYPAPWEIYVLSQTKNMNKLEGVLDLFTGGDYYLIKQVSDLSTYYLLKKDKMKLLVNIKDWVLEARELPCDINEKKFVYDNNKFTNCGILKEKKVDEK